eukprot:6490501-Amphidinium_carterae.4
MSAAERFEKVEPSDGPFMKFLAPFLREDESFRTIAWESKCDTELLEQYKSELRDGWFLRSKGPKVSSTRWGTMHVALKHLFGQWGHLLGVVLSLGFSAGWMRQGAGAIILERLSAKQLNAGNDGLRPKEMRKRTCCVSNPKGGTSTKEAKEKVQKLRDSFSNTTQLLGGCLSDRSFYSDCAMLMLGGEP